MSTYIICQLNLPQPTPRSSPVPLQLTHPTSDACNRKSVSSTCTTRSWSAEIERSSSATEIRAMSFVHADKSVCVEKRNNFAWAIAVANIAAKPNQFGAIEFINIIFIYIYIHLPPNKSSCRTRNLRDRWEMRDAFPSACERSSRIPHMWSSRCNVRG